jgi:hypothetical protein
MLLSAHNAAPAYDGVLKGVGPYSEPNGGDLLGLPPRVGIISIRGDQSAVSSDQCNELGEFLHWRLIVWHRSLGWGPVDRRQGLIAPLMDD